MGAGLALVIIVAAPTVLAGPAAAGEPPPKLTFESKGVTLPVGYTPHEPLPLRIETAVPLRITIPSEKRTLRCSPKGGEALLAGWLMTNGRATNRIRFAQETGLDETRQCDGITVGGHVLLGALQLHSSGAGKEILIPAESAKFQVIVGACSFSADSLAAGTPVPGRFEPSFSGTFTGDGEPGCAPAAEVAVGPFKATYQGKTVETSVG